ncbi:class I SAM-dependent methyltransferase family protein [Candidatus Bathyarchaeota archaeon]|nr:class I SAM-dependent methyltransferase family protein [Candidatus Bathyarchaeota archaeon]
MLQNIKSLLKDIIPEDKIGLLRHSYDIIGSKQKSVAIIEIPEPLKNYETDIAEAIMQIHKNVVSVLAKESKRDGDFRMRDFRLLAGDEDTEVIHKEADCSFRLDPRRVYFSPRECSERDRLVKKVSEGEEILVMFSGIFPIPIRIAKKFSNLKVTGVELNPYAYNYGVENIYLNKVEDRVEAILGDVVDVCPNLRKQFDRIIMPLPKGAYRFLDIAIPLLKDSGIIHFYHWGREPDLFAEGENLIAIASKKFQKSVEVIERTRVSQYSPRVWKIRIDVLAKSL